MGKMKQLYIQQCNEEMEEALRKHDQEFSNVVYESGLPLWMTSMYDNYLSLQQEEEEVESRSLGRIISDDTPQEVKDRVMQYGDAVIQQHENPMMNYIQFCHSDEGENYHAFFGNWADAYQSYRNDKLNPL